MLLTGRLHIGGKVGGILLAGVARGAFGESAARVLPDLPLVVPVEPKLGELARNLAGLLVGELNPDPLANDLGQLQEAGRFLLEQHQDPLGGQLAIRPAAGEIDRWKRRTLDRG